MSLDIEAGLLRPKIDTHSHVWSFDDESHVDISTDHLVESGKPLGICETWPSSPYIGPGFPSVEQVRRENDAVLRAMKHRPEYVRGMCYILASHYRDALAEVQRCFDAGMVGIKLYYQYKVHDPVQWPVIELASELRMPVLVHAGYLTDPDDIAGQPLTSHGEDFARINERYPEAILIHAHIGGGGDWERTVRYMRNTSRHLYVDVSGSNLDDGQVEYAVAELGAERVLFGTDGTMTGCVGKVLDADITEEERELIFWGNAERLLADQGRKPLQPRTEGGTS